MRQARRDWWRGVANRRDDLLIKLYKAKAPYSELKRAIQAQEKEFIGEARTPLDRLHIRRLAAHSVLTEAFASGAGGEEFLRCLRRCERLGYADVTHHIHAASLYVQMLPHFPKRTLDAFAMLAEVERILKHIPKSHYLRKEGMERTAHARAVAEAAGITPPDAATLKATSRPRASRAGRLPRPKA